MQEDIERKTIVLTTNATKISGKLLGIIADFCEFAVVSPAFK